MASKAIGIDLGTTNSCVAVMEGKTPKVIENQEGGGRPFYRRFCEGWRNPGRTVGQTAGDHQSGKHDFRD